MKSLVQLILLTVLISCKLTAQPYYFRNYQVERGLSNNTVFCSIQDKKGFLWFGTKEGLNRFDGYTFKLFKLYDNDEKSLVSDRIHCLFIDRQGILWVGSETGLYKYDAEREQLVRFLDSLQEINGIQTDGSGQLWCISRYTVCRYNFTTGRLKTFPASSCFSATSICLSEDGLLWFSTTDGLLKRYDPVAETFTGYDVFSHSPSGCSRWIQKIYPAGRGAIFIGTSSQGIKRYDIQSGAYKDIMVLNPDRTAIFVRDIVQYSRNEFWFATESGIFIYNTDNKKFINLRKKFLDPYSLSDNAIYTLCKDSEGGIWAGTYFGGINYFQKEYSSFQKYFPDNTNNSISGSSVREICEDHYGNIWIGTEDAGLNKLNKHTGAITHFKPSGKSSSIAYSNIHGLAIDGNDLWIGTFEHGLDRMDTRTGKVKKHYTAGPGPKDLKNNFIVSLLHTRSGEIYAGSGGELYHYDRKADGFDRVPEVPGDLFISCLFEDHTNTIWVGTVNHGLFYFNPLTKQKGKFENVPDNKNSLTTNSLNAIYEDVNSNLWISTEGGGLCKLDAARKQFSRFTKKNGLPSNFVFKTLEDNRKNLWVTTSRGLLKLNPAKQSTTIYTKANGLLNNQFNYNSGYKDEDGKIYFGSVKGMISFKPDECSPVDFTPPVYITGFQVNNTESVIAKENSPLKKSIIYTDKITLPYDQSSFSIDFAALSYVSPEMTAYNYIMEGLDKEWTYVKSNRKVYFTNLSQGKYIFKLKAAANGRWSNTEKQLAITILPPIWATTGAYLVYAAILIILAYYLISNYHKRIEDKKEKEIYEAKLDFFTNIAHEIRTPLTLIKGPLENLLEIADEAPGIKTDLATMERNTNRLMSLISQILDFRQTETKGFSLSFSKLNITELLQETFSNFEPLARKANLDYTIEMPAVELVVLADEEALNKILCNLFSNAVKYAHKVVKVRLHPPATDETDFTIGISNDGYTIPAAMKERIFEPFYRLKESRKQKGTGIGLALARSLAELHGGRLYLEDPQTGPDPQAGMNTFVLCLPVRPRQGRQVKSRRGLSFMNQK